MREIREFESPDKASAAFADSGERIRTSSDGEVVLIEGSEEALVRLAELILAQAAFRKDDGFEVSPTGAGQRIFEPGSSVGLYLRVLR